MAGNDDYQVWMEAEAQGSRLDVVPYVTAERTARLRYELVFTKQGRSGRASSRQSATVVVSGRTPRALSRLGLSLQEGDRYEISLQAYVHDRLVAAETLHYP